MMLNTKRAVCGICGVELGIVKSQVKDGYLCRLCVSHLSVPDYSRMRELTVSEIESIIAAYPINSVEPLSLTGRRIPENELRQYKKMLDEGLITDEEYELKKKKLLKL